MRRAWSPQWSRRSNRSRRSPHDLTTNDRGSSSCGRLRSYRGAHVEGRAHRKHRRILECLDRRARRHSSGPRQRTRRLRLLLVKDLVGHIAFWDEQDLARAHKLPAARMSSPTIGNHERSGMRSTRTTRSKPTARMTDAHAMRSRVDDRQLKLILDHYDAMQGHLVRKAEGISV